jgi:class 3 adenylate cyclase
MGSSRCSTVQPEPSAAPWPSVTGYVSSGSTSVPDCVSSTVVEVGREGIAGLPVHIGARVMSLAVPGDVLEGLVAGAGIEFEDRGSHALKGVPGEWRIFAVRQ